jgi:putative PIN family toxin of toxin-antitoxin system
LKKVVLDTNVIVSALWSESGNATKILEMFLQGKLRLCYDARIMAEYKGVLNRPQLAFKRTKIGSTLNRIRNDGISVVPGPCNADFTDEDDKKFYEVAKACGAILITGNLRHYPAEPSIMTPAQFLSP